MDYGFSFVPILPYYKFIHCNVNSYRAYFHLHKLKLIKFKLKMLVVQLKMNFVLKALDCLLSRRNITSWPLYIIKSSKFAFKNPMKDPCWFSSRIRVG